MYFAMKNICHRFPSVIELVLDNLDDKNLVNCREASREMSKFLPKGRIRIIKHYSAKFESFENSWRQVINKASVENSWRKVINKTSVEVIKEVQDFFGRSHKSDGFIIASTKKIAPLHIAVEQENLKLCEHILDKTENKNPKGDMTLLSSQGVCKGYRVTNAPTPLHVAALKGNFQMCHLIIGHIDVKKFDVDTFRYGCHSWTF